MKLLPIAIASLCIAAHPTVSHASTVLFQENWSNVAVGGNAVSSGQWTMPIGQPTQYTVSENPLPSLSGKWLSPVTYIGTSDMPKLVTNESFDLTNEGIRVSFGVAMTDRNNSNNYLRLGIQNAAEVNYRNNYWIEVFGTYIRLAKIAEGTVSNIESFTYSSEMWELNTAATISLSITPQSSGAVELVVHLNDNEIIRRIDAAGSTPNFGEGFNVFLASRQPREAYLGAVQLQTIPEGSSYAMLLGGAGLLIGAKRFVGFSFKK